MTFSVVSLMLAFAALVSAEVETTNPAYVTYEGACDASGAIQVGPHLMVIDDEAEPSNALRFYDPTNGGKPTFIAELSTSAIQFDPKEPELDLEAVTRIGGTYWAIGSHSRSKTSLPRWSRQNLLSFRVEGETAIAESSLSSIIPALGILLRASDKDMKNIDPEREPKEGGLSIEGLVGTPSGDLLIGLRSPLASNGSAFVVRLTEPHQASKLNRASPYLGRVFRLKLEGTGVRDLTFDESKERYLILSGPVGPGNPFKIWSWNGGDDNPMEVKDISHLVPEGTSAEAIVRANDGKGWWILLDEGTRLLSSGKECKDASSAQRAFRGFRVDDF